MENIYRRHDHWYGYFVLSPGGGGAIYFHVGIVPGDAKDIVTGRGDWFKKYHIICIRTKLIPRGFHYVYTACTGMPGTTWNRLVH